MYRIAQETINSNFSQNAMDRNRSREKKNEKLPFTELDLHACLNGFNR